jgi:aerobic C4-dicarboxylate transport protein
MADVAEVAPSERKPLYYSLYFQVIVGITLGIILGFFVPNFAAQLKPLGDAFIKLIKMLIGPIIFGTVAVGIAKMGDLKEVGRVGLKALIYFEVLTTIALAIGLVVANVYQPGGGINADPASFDTKAIAAYTTKAQQMSTVDYLMHIIPNTVVGAFSEGEILQVLLFAFVGVIAVT